jgi:hypothetical protein
MIFVSKNFFTPGSGFKRYFISNSFNNAMIKKGKMSQREKMAQISNYQARVFPSLTLHTKTEITHLFLNRNIRLTHVEVEIIIEIVIAP